MMADDQQNLELAADLKAAASGKMTADALLSALKAAGEATRLRLLALLASGELNVKDLTRIMGQSQPRISRHLKLLTDAGLIERFREGSWVYFRLAARGAQASMARAIVESLDASAPELERDRARAAAVLRERAEAAQDYFKANAAEWDAIRSLHLAEDQVEAAILDALGPGPFECLVDLGTGTGRMLELFASRANRAIGVDVNRDMLAYARAKLEASQLGHCQVRHGDLFGLAFADGEADAVILHQVLHYLDDPAAALQEAARILMPGGRLLIVDFAPHDLEFLREEHAHRRLGLEAAHVEDWVTGAGLRLKTQRDLEPAQNEGAQKLTVSFWVADKPGAVRARAAEPAVMELEGAS